LLAVSTAHNSISQGLEDILTAGTASLIGAVMLRLDLKSEKEKNWAIAFVNIGNCKAFVKRKNGKVEDLTPLHGNSSDPGGRIGPYLEEGEPDLRNLKLYLVKCEEGDIFFMCSGGTLKNLDQGPLNFTPTDYSDNWMHVTEPSQTANEVSNTFRAKLIEDIIKKGEIVNAEVIVKQIIKYCVDITKKSREFMELNPLETEPNRKEYLSKFSDCTCVAFSIGKSPFKTLLGKNLSNSSYF